MQFYEHQQYSGNKGISDHREPHRALPQQISSATSRRSFLSLVLNLLHIEKVSHGILNHIDSKEIVNRLLTKITYYPKLPALKITRNRKEMRCIGDMSKWYPVIHFLNEEVITRDRVSMTDIFNIRAMWKANLKYILKYQRGTNQI